MIYLILINNAPSMAEYHKGLGDQLEREGNEVYYAATDHICLREVSFNSNLFVFSDFFKINAEKSSIGEKYKKLNFWEAYFSDFDRNVTHYGIEPKDINYHNKLFANLICFFDEIINTKKVSTIIYENISNSFAYFAYLIGKENNANYIGYLPSRLPGRFELQSEVFNNVNEFRTVFEITDFKIQPKFVRDFVETYLRNYEKDIPSYHTRNHPLSYDYSLSKLYLNKGKVNLLIKGIKSSVYNSKDSDYNYQLGNILGHYFKLFKRQIGRRFKARKIMKLFDNVDLSDQFFLMPLQFKPESSTSVWARNFTDDYNNILNICFNLPIGTFLYVKEHFVNLGLPELNYYKKLKRIPNLKLINPNEANRPLIQKSKCLIVLTSTMGFEALMLGKKVITFGDIFYQCHPNCIKLNDFKDLFEILLNMDQNDIGDVTAINKKFIAAYYNLSFEGDIDYVAYDKFNPKKFSDLVSTALNKISFEK